MTVPNIPFTLSQANTEFGGTGRASDIMNKAGLGTTGLVSRLQGKSALVLLNGVTTPVKTFCWFYYDAATNTTNQVHNQGGVQQTVQIFRGKAWVRIRNGGVTYNGCSDGQWFLADATNRGVYVTLAGVTRSVSIDFSAQQGGTIVYAPTVTIQNV